MDSNLTTRSAERLLLNAEPFGFGPTSAIAAIFPHLRERFDRIGFVGSDLALDVQRRLPYDEIHDLSGLDGPRLDRAALEVARDYDLFFTAMNFPLLEVIRAAGTASVGYDALTWYWRELPAGIGASDLYLAQNFFGVRERIESERERFPDYALVPPIVPKPAARGERTDVLINMGGLQNPLWSVDEAAEYARKMLSALKGVIPEHERVIIATSAAVAERVGSSAVTYSREEIRGILGRSKYAFMTPGLGNIYDAAVFDLPTVWLPPANDSQGQQLLTLQEQGLLDGHVDWSTIAGAGRPIAYRDSQHLVLQEITRCVIDIPVERLSDAFAAQIGEVLSAETSRTRRLMEIFGCEGDRQVAQHLVDFASRSS